MEPWLLWALVAVLLVVGEIVTGTFFLAAIALACVVTGAGALLGLGVAAQLVLFIVSGGVLALGSRPLAERLLHPPGSRQLQTNVGALVGTTGYVREEIGTGGRPGRVAVGGDDWRAVSGNGLPIAPGEAVMVVSVRGATLTVVREPDLEV
jgi:membrane protein implicated in regulation of membrane protease activity